MVLDPGGYLTHVYTGRLLREVQPLTFYIPFFTKKKYRFSIPSIDKRYPFHILCLEFCIPLSPFGPFLKTQMTDFPTPLHNSTSKIPTFHIKIGIYKRISFRVEPPCRPSQGVPPPPVGST